MDNALTESEKSAIASGHQACRDYVYSAARLRRRGRDAASEFRSDLWKGLVALNSAALVASTALLGVDGIQMTALKIGGLAFWIALNLALFAWVVGVGAPWVTTTLVDLATPTVLRTRRRLREITGSSPEVLKALRRQRRAVRITGWLALIVVHGQRWGGAAALLSVVLFITGSLSVLFAALRTA